MAQQAIVASNHTDWKGRKRQCWKCEDTVATSPATVATSQIKAKYLEKKTCWKTLQHRREPYAIFFSSIDATFFFYICNISLKSEKSIQGKRGTEREPERASRRVSQEGAVAAQGGREEPEEQAGGRAGMGVSSSRGPPHLSASLQCPVQTAALPRPCRQAASSAQGRGMQANGASGCSTSATVDAMRRTHAAVRSPPPEPKSSTSSRPSTAPWSPLPISWCHGTALCV